MGKFISSELNPIQRVFRKLNYWVDHYFFECFIAERLYPLLFNHILMRRGDTPVPSPASVKTILIWNIDSIGDLLWITPSLQAIRKGYPHAKITLICNSKAREVVDLNPNLDEIIGINAELYYTGRGYFRPIPSLENRHFDLMFILEMGSRPADRARLYGRTNRVGYMISSNLGLLKGLPHHLLPKNQGSVERNWAKYYLMAVEHLGLKPDFTGLEVTLTQKDHQSVQLKIAHLLVNQEKFFAHLVIHPCVAAYANATKKWPNKNYVECVRRLCGEKKLRIFVTGSPPEKQECDALVEAMKPHLAGSEAYSVAGLLNVREMVSFLGVMDAVVVGDTAVLHLASAAKTPTVAIFGATHPKTIAPDSPICRIVTHEISCRPCHQNKDRSPFWPTCIFSEPKCLTSIRPEKIAAEVFSLIEQTRANGRDSNAKLPS